MGKARAEIEVTASSQKLAADLNAASAQFKSWAAATARTADRQFKGIGKGVSKAASRGGGALAHFGGDMLTRGFDRVLDAAEGVRTFERDLTRLGITANLGPAAIDKMRTSIRQVSKDTGVSSQQILQATSGYVDLTGDVAGASTMMRTFARTAQASGSDMNDISTAAAALGDSLHIKPEEMESTFSGLINQGKAGAVTLKDLAGELTGLAPKFARFKGMMGREGAIQLGAAMQVARHGFGSASEAATGLESLMGGLTKHADKFAAAGVKVFDIAPDGTKTFRNLSDIVKEISTSGLAKDPQLLIKAFGRKEGEAMFNTWARLLPMWDQMLAAGQDTDAVNRDLMTYLQSSSGRVDAAFNRMKESIAGAFTPERIEKFASAMERVSNAVGKGVDGVEKFADAVDVEDKNQDRSDHGTSSLGKFAVKSLLFGNATATNDELQKDQEARAKLQAKAMFLPPGSTEGDAARRELGYDAAREELRGLKGEDLKKRALGLATGMGKPAGSDLFGFNNAGGRMGEAQAARDVLEQMHINAAQAQAETLATLKTIAANTAALAAPAAPKVEVTANAIASGAKKSTNARSGR